MQLQHSMCITPRYIRIYKSSGIMINSILCDSTRNTPTSECRHKKIRRGGLPNMDRQTSTSGPGLRRNTGNGLKVREERCVGRSVWRCGRCVSSMRILHWTAVDLLMIKRVRRGCESASVMSGSGVMAERHSP